MDANILLHYITGIDTLTRLTNPNLSIEPHRLAAFEQALARRLKGEPVHRIIGQREFYGLPLIISDDTLVPRPDTETLVDMTAPFVAERINDNGTCNILDLGTGTGAIALALLSVAPKATAVGVDVSEKALKIAQLNAKNLDLDDRFIPLQSDWFENVRGQFDLIVSNPPYIAHNVIATLDTDVRDFDPHLALDGGVDGLNAYALIAARAHQYLRSNGRIGVEVGYDQSKPVIALFEAAGFHHIMTLKDISDHERALFFALNQKMTPKGLASG